MSDFAGEGFKPFPNTHADTLSLRDIANETIWPTENLERKVHEYGQFLNREDIMIRARTVGGRILTHLIEEIAHREGVYDDCLEEKIKKNEDEICQNP